MNMSVKTVAFAAALSFGAITGIGLSGPASAMTVIPGWANSGATLDVASEVKQVDHRRYRKKYREGRRKFRYERKRHGKRHSRRHGHYRYYNDRDGYWYALPFWLGALAIAQAQAQNDYYYNDPYEADVYGGGDAHVRWCLNRYRSYNIRTDTFRGYDGYDHRCRSPYSY